MRKQSASTSYSWWGSQAIPLIGVVCLPDVVRGNSVWSREEMSLLRARSHGEPGLDGFPCCCPVLPDLGLQTSSPSFHLSDSLMIVPSAIFRVYNCAYEEGMGKLGLHHLFWTRSLTHVLYIELPYLPVWIPYYQFILFYQCVSCILFLTVNAINICY